MKTYSFSLVAALAMVSTGLVGCDESIVSPAVEASTETAPDLVTAVSSTESKELFDCADRCGTKPLTLSELVALTPYLTESKKFEEATVAEVVAIMPIADKFASAFKVRMAEYSVAQVLGVLEYMRVNGKNHFPYPYQEVAENPT